MDGRLPSMDGAQDRGQVDTEGCLRAYLQSSHVVTCLLLKDRCLRRISLSIKLTLHSNPGSPVAHKGREHAGFGPVPSMVVAPLGPLPRLDRLAGTGKNAFQGKR